ncbi:hypothetical protein [Nonomuraea dietziae]|uniref:hypothetical protein n=1 Tax=Nonomuraea dietziae TaxID=65515 RepID=UPI0031D1D65F
MDTCASPAHDHLQRRGAARRPGRPLPAGRCAELHNCSGPTEAAIDVSSWQCTSSKARGAGHRAHRLAHPEHHPARSWTGTRAGPVGVPASCTSAASASRSATTTRPALTAERSPAGRTATGDVRPLAARRHHRVPRPPRRPGQAARLRIELGEIETALREKAGPPSRRRRARRPAVAYLLGGPPNPLQVRPRCRGFLPEYMLPSAVRPVWRRCPSPRTAKLDRKALPGPSLSADAVYAPLLDEGREGRRESGPRCSALHEWGIDDDFFPTSEAPRLTWPSRSWRRRARRRIGPVGLVDVFTYRTVRERPPFAAPPEQGARPLLQRLTPAREARRSANVCVPYGSGQRHRLPAAGRRPRPADQALYALAIPATTSAWTTRSRWTSTSCGQDDRGDPAHRGPPGDLRALRVGAALAVELARGSREAGREVEALYIGADLPFAGRGAGCRFDSMEPLRSSQLPTSTGSRPAACVCHLGGAPIPRLVAPAALKCIDATECVH